MKLMTKRFGEIETDDDLMLEFPKGMVGFTEYKKFAVIETGIDALGIKWLQSADEPSLGFVIMDPFSVFPAYFPEITETDLSDLKTQDRHDLLVMAVVTVPKTVEKTSVNLQAPLIINPLKKLGKQVILSSPEYTTKHNVFSKLESLVKRTG